MSMRWSSWPKRCHATLPAGMAPFRHEGVFRHEGLLLGDPPRGRWLQSKSWLFELVKCPNHGFMMGILSTSIPSPPLCPHKHRGLPNPHPQIRIHNHRLPRFRIMWLARAKVCVRNLVRHELHLGYHGIQPELTISLNSAKEVNLATLQRGNHRTTQTLPCSEA